MTSILVARAGQTTYQKRHGTIEMFTDRSVITMTLRIIWTFRIPKEFHLLSKMDMFLECAALAKAGRDNARSFVRAESQ